MSQTNTAWKLCFAAMAFCYLISGIFFAYQLVSLKHKIHLLWYIHVNVTDNWRRWIFNDTFQLLVTLFLLTAKLVSCFFTLPCKGGDGALQFSFCWYTVRRKIQVQMPIIGLKHNLAWLKRVQHSTKHEWATCML